MSRKFYQISYPRSGATWTRYIARHLLNVDAGVPPTSEGFSNVYLKFHYLHDELEELGLPLEKGRDLVLVLRDFRQCIYSHLNKRDPKHCDFCKYANPIITFDEWVGNKFIMRYEWLLTNHEETIRQFAAWLECDPFYVLAYYTPLKQTSLNDYKHKRTDGKMVSPHKKTINWDSFLPRFLTDKQIQEYLGCYL